MTRAETETRRWTQSCQLPRPSRFIHGLLTGYFLKNPYESTAQYCMLCGWNQGSRGINGRATFQGRLHTEARTRTPVHPYTEANPSTSKLRYCSAPPNVNIIVIVVQGSHNTPNRHHNRPKDTPNSTPNGTPNAAHHPPRLPSYPRPAYVHPEHRHVDTHQGHISPHLLHLPHLIYPPGYPMQETQTKKKKRVRVTLPRYLPSLTHHARPPFNHPSNPPRSHPVRNLGICSTYHSTPEPPYLRHRSLPPLHHLTSRDRHISNPTSPPLTHSGA